jgi:hypothetical protein
MTGFLDKLCRTGIANIQKIEWFELFVKAHEKAVTVNNIHGGWRGAGIYPFCPEKVLNKLPKRSTISTLQSESTEAIALPFDQALKEDSPMSSEHVRSANTALNGLVNDKKPLNTPARKYTRRLGAAVEYLLAENELLLQEIKTCRDTLGARKTRKTGKRMRLEGAIVLSLKEYYEAARDCEKATRAKRKPIGKPRGRPRKNASKKPVDDEEEEDDELEALEVAFAETLVV